MTTATINVEAICAGLGHWNVTVTDGVASSCFLVDWDSIQMPLAVDELQQFALLLLRLRYAGVPVNALGDLLLNGVVV